jgi:uncharacterized protein
MARAHAVGWSRKLMRVARGRLIVTPTDLANFLTCRHKTALDLRVAAGVVPAPVWVDPFAYVLQQRGRDHEARYVGALRDAGLAIVDFGATPPAGGALPFDERLERTRDAMRQGVDVIVQGALGNAEWAGYPDVLRRTGDGGYEAVDTKLSRETRGGTMLQLCVYTDLLRELQGRAPGEFHVVTPAAHERYRFDDYSAYFRAIKGRLLDFLRDERPAATAGAAHEPATTYPDPVDHCEVCRWWAHCNRRRRADDHLSFVHGLGRNHIKELTARGIATLAALAAEPLPLAWKPSRGSVETFARMREQARVQRDQRDRREPIYECLPPDPGFGLSALPEPNPGDLFLDLEGDPFGRPDAGSAAGEGQREYLFGLAHVLEDGSLSYRGRWAFSDEAERQAFDDTMGDIMAAIDANPGARIYHYNHYEVTAFKRLAGRYAMRESDLDRLLRGKRFVDLYAIVRRGVRAGVESYSLKDLEPFYGFARDVELEQAGDQRRLVEVALETGDLQLVTLQVSAAVEGYNRDDVRSTAELRRWLESVRAGLAALGQDLPRPAAADDQPSPRVDERAQRVAAIRARLLAGVPGDASARTPDDHARYLLAYLLDYHRREDKAEWWDYFRLRELPEADLIDEPKAVAGLVYDSDVETVKKSVVQRYRFPEQEIEIRPGETLKRQDGKSFADAVRVDRHARTIDMLVGPSRVHDRPAALFAHDYINADVIEAALVTLGEQVAADGTVETMPPGPGRSLLLRLPPSIREGVFSAPEDGADPCDYACRIVTQLDATVLPIQGPPGSGKTYTGARMIEACVAAGLSVGVTASSHKVIRNLLKEVGGSVRTAHKCGDDEVDAAEDGVLRCASNEDAMAALSAGARVLGGTAWLWARPEFAGSVDVLFVDEAGQMSLANALAVARAGRSMVLLGDPQQLDQPSKGSHPDGVATSVLQHMLGPSETMPRDRGLFLAETWRLAPSICAFTSELFYAGRLRSRAGLDRQRLVDAGPFEGAGLWTIEVDHHGNRNASDEEAEAVARVVARLLRAGDTAAEAAGDDLPLFTVRDPRWIDADAASHLIRPGDIRVLTPFNAQVARIREALAARGELAAAVPVGTVDKFQGQQAAVAIYSLAASHPDDAPRGMEFLYSLNRLNVATSRARCASIIVLSPRLFEIDCRTPRRMRLANALGRFRELARAACP